MNSIQILSAFRKVSQSLEDVPSSQVGKSAGHKYICLHKDFITENVKNKASFEKIIELARQVLTNPKLEKSEKQQFLRDFQVITSHFAKKKLGFFQRVGQYLFGGLFFKEKATQIKEARELIAQHEKALQSKQAVQQPVDHPKPQEKVSISDTPAARKKELRATKKLATESAQPIKPKPPLTPEEKFGELLKKIQEAANRDLQFDEDAIEKQFQINEMLKSFPPEEAQQRRAQVNVVINKAFIARELREQGKLVTWDSDEERLLEYLGYPLSETTKPEIYLMIQNDVKERLTEEDYQRPLSDIKGAIKKIAFEQRLKSAGLSTPLERQKFLMLQRKFKTVKEQLQNRAQQYPLNVPPSSSFTENSPNLKYMDQLHGRAQNQVMDEALKKMFGSDLKAKLGQADLSASQFSQHLEEHVQQQARAFRVKSLDTSGVVEPHFEFFSKWQECLKTEEVQGINSQQEVLGEGICWGLCQRLQIEGIHQPALSLETLSQQNKIGPAHRFLQAFHEHEQENIYGLLPPKLAQKHGVEDRALFMKVDSQVFAAHQLNDPQLKKLGAIQRTDDVIGQFQDEVRKRDWSASQGWMRLSLMGENHTIALRIDEENNRAWLFDPNIGYFSFEANDSSFEESREVCLECLKDLLNLHYPNLSGIAVSQMQAR